MQVQSESGALLKRRLVVSIHDVGPRSEAAVERLLTLLSRYVPPSSIAMLVVPDHWGEAPIEAGTPFAGRLRDWAAQGHELFVHGWYHRDEVRHQGFGSRIKAKHMTAGEGEFLGLDAQECRKRMSDGKRLIEDITGKPVAGFIAPAWLYGPPALHALAEQQFPLAEDHWKVWRPTDGKVLSRSPVITWASRSRMRIASSLLAAAVLRRLLRPVPVVRLAVHPGDVTVPRIIASIEKTLADLVERRTVSRYADL